MVMIFRLSTLKLLKNSKNVSDPMPEKKILLTYDYQMLKRNVFFVSWPSLKIFCSVYYQSQVHSKYFCLMVRLENIPWRLLVTTIYTCCTSVIHLSENIFCFMAWRENILQLLLSGKSVWRSGLQTWFQVNKNFRFFRWNLHHKKN